ncbi:MAG: hypothetical protein IJW92_01035 [Clostridia bacterium]|nr:hypothetical protein [Clostridia bacterium]
MKHTKMLISGVRVSVNADSEMILNKAKDKMKRAGINTSTLHFRLYKKSVDARKREDIRFECTVLAESAKPAEAFSEAALKRADARIFEEPELEIPRGNDCLNAPPLVVGMGPAGLFAALLLARNGYAPILIDRGGSVEERVHDVARFRQNGVLNSECNVQFGAGGAGTFSDGKLITRINDPRCGFVLQTLVEFGAPEDVLIKAKPHIGTDILRTVVSNLLHEIERLGGHVIYHCRMDDINELPDGTLAVKTSLGKMHCGALILAPGHSARDTYHRLIEKNFAIEAKPISVGVRVEHLQADIDSALYGKFAGHPNLGPAEYSLSDTRTSRGIYTFCMCPGGEVVAAASEHEHLVVNGMSYHSRSNPNANAAVAVSIGCADLKPINGSLALGAIAFQRKLERAAFVAGGSDYCAPVMTIGDFLSGAKGTQPTRILPSYRDGKVRTSDFETVFPGFVIEALQYGLRSFGQKLKGYDAPDAILTAAETRTSAPLRILRNAETMTAIGHDRIYPCGEGAGYAGGITSAAVDGLRSALGLMARFAPND